MRLLLRTTISSAAKLLLIFFWCEIITIQVLLRSSSSPSSSSRAFYTSSVRSVTTVFINIANSFIAGVGAGSIPFLVTLLCIKFPDTNSMSVPRRKLKKSQGLFKQGLRRQAKEYLERRRKDKKEKKKQKKYKNSVRIKFPLPPGPEHRDDYDEEVYWDKYGKSKRNNNFLSYNKEKKSYLSSTPKAKKNVKRIERNNGININPALHTLYGSLLSLEKHAYSSTTAEPASFFHTPTKPVWKDKRKLNRQGKNDNEQAISSKERIASNSFIGGLFMNTNEEEALRLKILAKVEELDPLMCIPKVLCGYSSRQRQRKTNNGRRKPTTTTTTKRPFYLDEGLIDEYLHLLKIVPEEENEGKRKKKVKKNSNKKPIKNKRKNKSEYESEEDDDEEEEDRNVRNKKHHQGGSASSSSESNESIPYRRYPIVNSQRDRERDKQNKLKWLFNRNRDRDDDDDDDDDEENESGGDDQAEDDLIDDDEEFDDEDMNYLVEKAKMEKLMATSGANSEENWWEAFEPPKLPYGAYPTEPDYDPLKTPTESDPNGGITGWFSNMFSNFMPRVSWAGSALGGGGNKDDMDFKSDPFFTSFDGRSLKGTESQSFFSGTASTDSTTTTTAKSRSNLSKSGLRNIKTFSSPKNVSRRRTGRRFDVEQLLGVQVVDRRQSDINEGDGRDPAEKYRVAVEVGKRLANPGQCDFIYNGCPLSYEEILAIINEPLKEALNNAVSSTSKAPTTKVPTLRPKTSRPVTKRVNTPKSNGPTYGYNYITIPSSPTHLMMMPLQNHQTYHPNPYEMNVLYQQRPQQYHQLLHNQLHQYNYNQQFQKQQQQQQLQYIQQNMHTPHPQQNQQFFQHQYQIFQTPSPSTSSLDELTEQWGKKSTSKPHKTRIHQDLPSGELEINLLYSDKKAKTGLQKDEENVEVLNDLNDSEYTEGTEGEKGETVAPLVSSSGGSSSSASVAYEDPMQNQLLSEPFKRKHLDNKNQQQQQASEGGEEVVPVPSKGYKIKKKNEENETVSFDAEKDEETLNKDIGKRKFKVDNSKTEELDNIVDVMSLSVREKPENPIRREEEILMRQQRPGEIQENLKGKYEQYKPLAPETAHQPLMYSFISPIQHSSGAFNVKQTGFVPSQVEVERIERTRKGNENVNMISSKKKRKKKGQRKSGNNNDSGNSSSSSSSNEAVKQQNQYEDDEEYHNDNDDDDDDHSKRKKKKRRKHNKTHLHKQSSESSEVEKRVTIRAPAGTGASSGGHNAMYSVYGHPFPPPYASYYNTPTPTTSSFFSYFFGR